MAPDSQVQLPLLRWLLTCRWWMRLAIVGISLLGTVCGILAPLTQKIFVDRLTGQQQLEKWLESGSFDMSTVLLSGFGFFALAQLLGLLAGFVAVREGIRLQATLSDALYKKVIGLRTDQLHGMTVGEQVGIFATDVPAASAVVDQGLPMAAGIIFPLLIAPLAVHFTCGIPVWQSVAVISGIVLLDIFLASRQARFFARYKLLAMERTGLVNEWIQNIRALRILSWVEAFEARIFRKRQEETVNRVDMLVNGQIMGTFGSTVSFFINLLGVTVLLKTKIEPPTPGELFALLWIFAVFLNRPFRQVPWMFTIVLDSLSSVRRLDEYLRRPSEAPELYAAPPSDMTWQPGKLEVRGLRVQASQTVILDGIDFSIEPGKLVAIVGEVGSGKSTLLLSLIGEVEADFEKFDFGDTNVLTIDKASRRSLFSFVPQDGFVMSASLRDNVAFSYGISASNDPKLEESLSRAQFELSREFAGDLSTQIGERGVNLSGGQRQRVGLARAHFHQAPIVLLDDSLSAVDVDTERRLMDSLISGDWQKRTRILVTHRLSILPLCDCVIYMRKGKIDALGKYQDLVDASDEFRAFAKSLNPFISRQLSVNETKAFHVH